MLGSASLDHQAIVRPKHCNGAQPLIRLLDTGGAPALQLQQLLRLQSAEQAKIACTSAHEWDSRK